MPLLTDKDQIRAILRRDPQWCVYALGDLTPRMFAKCRWFTPDLTMVLHDYGTAILFADGPGSIREALDHVAWPVHLQVQQDALEEIRRYATVTNEKQMVRMAWAAAQPRAADLSAVAQSAKAEGSDQGAKRLDHSDVAALERLYADGDATGEAPDFFYASMVTDGVFFGVYESGDLVAAAGTHLVARDESAAAIGNIYTRRDRRGRGLGRITTTAVLNELAGIETIGLNVRADNDAARHLYESIGFTRHCQFFEALASRA